MKWTNYTKKRRKWLKTRLLRLVVVYLTWGVAIYLMFKLHGIC